MEWPVVLEGDFPERYLRAARADGDDRHAVAPALLPGLREGGLAPRFGFVANGADPAGIVIAGNEEVLIGRLEDAAFA